MTLLSEVPVFAAGGYRYIKAVFQYSGGVAAEPSFEIERARLERPLPLAEGFAAIEAHLKSIGRPLAAFCACELRSPAPFTEQGFLDLNKLYAQTLERWGLYRDGANPVARSNVCPLFQPPSVPSFYAFSYTVPAKPGRRDSFIVAGGAEAPEGKSNYRDHIVAPGDTSVPGLRRKVSYVVKEMENRLSALSASWAGVTVTQAYSVHDIGPLVLDEIVRRGAAPQGLTWQFCRPPVVGLDYEMDARAPARELICRS